MISPSDPDYIETKLIKLGERERLPIFDDLAKWIEETYRGVTVLNAYYDTTYRRDVPYPRLNVIFEREADERRFLTPDKNFSQVEAEAIGSRFIKLVKDHHARFSTARLFVIFSAFEPVARTEAIWELNDTRLGEMADQLADPAIWVIRKNWIGAVVFFYTDTQLKELGTTEFAASSTKKFTELLEPCDVFGYFKERPADIALNSKQNFDKKYNGSWFNYDR